MRQRHRIIAAQFRSLQQQRIRISTQDLYIAAIALTNGCTLVTRNRRDFERVPGLVSEGRAVSVG